MLRPGKKFYKRPSLVAACTVLLVAALIVPTGLVLTATAETKAGSNVETKSAKSLHEAAADGDVEKVKLLISAGADVNAKNKDGDTALHIASKQCRVEIAEILVAKGADVSVKDRIAQTPLHYVGSGLFLAEHGRGLNETAGTLSERRIRKMGELLITNGADVNAAYPAGGLWTPLHYAVRHGYKGLAEVLIAKGADINARNMVNIAPVDCAIVMTTLNRREEARKAAELLVAKGADVSAIHWAAFIGDIQKVKEFIGQGVDVNAKEDRMAATPLLFAVSGGQKDVIRFLIAQGADVNARARVLSTALHVAVLCAEMDIIELLLDQGADVNQNSMFGTPLDISALFARTDAASLLIRNGANVNATSKISPFPGTALHKVLLGAIVIDLGMGWPPVRMGQTGGFSDLLPTTDRVLIKHVLKQRKALLELLLSSGADIEAEPLPSDTLHVLARLDAWELADPLIAHGLDVNTKYKGNTALHTAAEYGSKRMAELLVAEGGDVKIKDNQGRTALSLAKEKGHQEIVELLRKNGAKE